MEGGAKLRKFKSPEKKYRSPNFKTARRPKSPSPKRRDYEKLHKQNLAQNDARILILKLTNGVNYI